MRIAADTNILVRVLTEDDAHQSAVAQVELETADLVAIPISALCEVAWVLSTNYRLPRPAIAEGIRRLVNAENVAADTNAVEAGLAQLDAGGDFADGVIDGASARQNLSRPIAKPSLCWRSAVRSPGS